MSGPDLAIGEIADACTTTVSAVRYYADIGLLVTSRRVGGKRRFPASAVARVEFIRRCQEAGFALEEIGEILNDEHGRWRDIVDVKLIELHDRRRRLDTTIEVLTEVRECGCTALDQCDVFERC